MLPVVKKGIFDAGTRLHILQSFIYQNPSPAVKEIKELLFKDLIENFPNSFKDSSERFIYICALEQRWGWKHFA